MLLLAVYADYVQVYSAKDFFVALFLIFCPISSGVTRDNASLGQNSTHFGFISQRSQTKAFPLLGCKSMPPNSHASTHQQQPSHLSSSTTITPVFSSTLNAFLGQLLTHLGSSHRRQAIEVFISGSMRTVRILEIKGLNPPSLTAEQTSSHKLHPVHFSGSETMNLRCILPRFLLNARAKSSLRREFFHNNRTF
jgi:hypothetical protein